jgi:zinc protease
MMSVLLMTASLIQRIDRPDGITVLLAENHALPRVSFRVSLRSGSADDPPLLLGLSRLHAELVLRGTKTHTRHAFSEAIEGYGSSLSGDAASDGETWAGEALSRYFEPTFALLAEALMQPAFSPKELEKLVRELEAERVMRRDDDGTLARLFYRRLVFGDHPYGRDSLGTPKTLSAVTPQAIHDEHLRRLVTGNVVIGAAGDVTLAQLTALIDKYLQLPKGASLAHEVPAPPEPQGFKVYLVDKPERTQAQILFGRPALKATNPDFLALQTASTAFGGTFTAPLMHEVREVRGWSYGAYATLAESRGRGTFAMSAAPSEADAAPCLALMVELYKRFVEGNYEDELFQFGRQYLLQQYPFAIATPDALLSEHMHGELVGLPPDAVETYPARLSALQVPAIRRIPQRYLSATDLVIVVVGTAAHLQKPLEQLPFVQGVTVLPFDTELEFVK